MRGSGRVWEENAAQCTRRFSLSNLILLTSVWSEAHVYHLHGLSRTNGGNGGWILAPPTVGEENICLTAGTLIKTTDGEIPIEELRTGMQVTAYEGGARAIRWIGHRHFDEVALRKQPKLRPVRILAGAMGNELPKRDLLVSRQHRLLVRSKIAERMFGVPEDLISAIKMTKLAGIFVDETAKSVDYFHLLFDRHEVIFAEGRGTTGGCKQTLSY